MIELISNSSHDWLSCYIIKLNITDQDSLDLEIKRFLTTTIANSQLTILIILQQEDEEGNKIELLNYLQFEIYKQSSKDIVVSIMTIPKGCDFSILLSSQLNQIDDIIKDILKLDLSIALDVVNKEKLIFLMLNIPNLLPYLEQQQQRQDDHFTIEELFQNFVKHHNSIKNILLSNELREWHHQLSKDIRR